MLMMVMMMVVMVMVMMVMVLMMMTMVIMMMMGMIVTLHYPLLLCFLTAPHSLLPANPTIPNVHPQNLSQPQPHNQLQKSHNLSRSSSAELSWSPLSDGDRALCDQWWWPPCTVRAHATNAQLRVPRSSTRGAARVSLVWSPPLFWSGLLCFGDLCLNTVLF